MIHSSTGKAPFEIVEDAMKVPPFLSTKDKIFEADEYTKDLDTAFAKVRETLQKSQEWQQIVTDITEWINDVSFRLRLPDTWKIHNAFHVSPLKLFKSDVPDDGEPDEQPEVEENEKILVPKQILAHKKRKRKKQGFKRHFTGKTIEERKALRDAKKCYICEGGGHFANKCPQRNSQDKDDKSDRKGKKPKPTAGLVPDLICLLCRKRGHSLKNCPNQSTEEEKKCYNCGSSGHRLADCKEPLKNGGTTFASCFLCKKEGHLSKNCPSNTHGIYPKGGCCKVCGGVTHLAKDCPEEKKTTKSCGAPRDKLVISREAAPTSGKHAKRIVFGSGDDLEDDFVDLEVDEDEEKRNYR
ncbi:hypothetical protein L7F22_003404 [Adiantum nelumboides]|nr:hypothetical protein [Adiantum nelumboides]